MLPVQCKEEVMHRKNHRQSLYSKENCSSFSATAKERGYKLRNPSGPQKAEHKDFVMIGVDKDTGTRSVTLDIKTLHSKSSDKWHWLEFRGPTGSPGWLYQEADFVIFERRRDFLLVNRKNLVDWVNITNKIRHDLPVVSNPWEAKYRLYSRPKKRELITQVRAQDLLEISGTQVWDKISQVT